jgi:hypothetical protein
MTSGQGVGLWLCGIALAQHGGGLILKMRGGKKKKDRWAVGRGQMRKLTSPHSMDFRQKTRGSLRGVL